MEFGPCNNRESDSQRWCRLAQELRDPLFDKLFLSSINIDPFTFRSVYNPFTFRSVYDRVTFNDNMLPTMSYLAWYGNHLIVHPNKVVNRNKVLVASWGDLMGPYIAESRIENIVDARMMFRRSVRALLQDGVLNTIADATNVTYTQQGDGYTNDEWQNVLIGQGVHFTDDSCMKILRHLANRAGAAFSIGVIDMLINVYLSILKAGMITEVCSNKIIERMAKDLQIQNCRIDLDACTTFFYVFGCGINNYSVFNVTQSWRTLLPLSAPKLGLTVQQAAGKGLATLSLTGRAIRVFVDFDWGQIVLMYSDEWVNLLHAITTVRNNVWYGFRQTFRVTFDRKYKHIAYVAKELLIKVNGESLCTLWGIKETNQVAIDVMITNYKEAKRANIMAGFKMPDVPDNARVNKIRDLIQKAPDMYV